MNGDEEIHKDLGQYTKQICIKTFVNNQCGVGQKIVKKIKRTSKLCKFIPFVFKKRHIQ